MSRRSGIRWTESQRKKLASAVRSFNARLRQAVARTSSELQQFLPSKASFQELLGSIQTSGELNIMLTRLNRPRNWAAKGRDALEVIQTDKGITTRQDLENARIRIRTENVRRAKERVARGIQVDGRILPGHRGEMEDLGIMPLRARAENLTQAQQRKQAERALEAARETPLTRAQAYYENYTTAMVTAGIDQNERAYFGILDIMNRIRKQAPREFERVFKSYDERVRIDFVYDDAIYLEERANALLDAWTDIENELEERGILE